MSVMNSDYPQPRLAGTVRSWLAVHGYNLLPILFMINAAIGIAHHSLWFDEAQNWSIVRDSQTIPELFHNLGYEGHPALWYLLLWVIQRFTVNVAAMKFAHWLLAAGSIALIGYGSPFRKLDRIFIMAGYFLILQYVLISRNYAIGMFLGFLYAYLEKNYLGLTKTKWVILGLLANCNVFTLFLSGALAIDRLFPGFPRKLSIEKISGQTLGLSLYTILVITALWTIYPAPDMKYAAIGNAITIHHNFDSAIKILHQMSFDLLDKISVEQMNEYGIYSASLMRILFILIFVISTIFILTPFMALVRTPKLLMIYSITICITFLFSFFYYPVLAPRHAGVLWLCFMICWWLKQRPTRLESTLVSLYFFVATIWGVPGLIQSYRIDFSNAQAAANWVQENGLTNEFWISYDDSAGVALSAFLGIPTYSPNCQCSHQHVVWNNRRGPLELGDVGAAILPVLQDRPGHVAYLIDDGGTYLANLPLDFEARARELRDGLDHAGIGHELLKTFTGAKSDNFSVYKLTGPK